MVLSRPARAQLAEGARSGAQQPDAPSERTEQKDKRTKYSKTFHNPDGSFTAEIYPDPIHFKEQGGAWREIDPTLEACNASGCAFRNKAGPTSIEFADSAAADEIIAIHDKSLKAAFGLQDANDSQAEADGSRVIYEDVYAGVDLVFEVDGTNVKELIVLNGPPLLEDPVFRFPLGLSQSRAVQRADGSVDIVDNQGDTEFSIPHLFMTDSSVDPQSDEPAFSEDVLMSLETRDRGQVLVVTPDAGWLRNARRVYPVTIDPSINDNPSRDTYVQSNISNTGQGGLAELKAGTYDGGATVARSLIKFDISAVKGANISEATFSIFNNHSWSCNARSVDVHRLLDDWAEGVTWPNRPRFGADVFASKSVAHGYTGCASQRIEFGVADMVRSWASGAWDNHGFGIKARNEADNYAWKKFASSEATSKPQLSVTYNHPPKEPTSLQPFCGTTQSDRSPSFSALYDDPNAGDGGWLDFEVYRDLDGDGVFADVSRSGRGTFADPGQRSSWTPDRPLDEGVAYKWRVRAFDHNDYSAWSDSGGTNKCAYNTTSAVPTVSLSSTTGHPECITSPEAWLANDDPGFGWSASDASGIAGYSFDFNQDRFYDPPRLNRSTATSQGYFDIPDGRWYFHLRAVDNAGYWSDIARYGVCVDDTAPAMSSASSSSHTDPNAWSSNNDPSFSWSASDTSGINGYSYELTQNPSPSFPAADVSEGTATTKSYLDVSPGEWYFHVRARNGANLWGTPRTVRIRIDDATGPSLSVSSTTGHPDCIPADAWVANDDPGFRWSASDPSGVAGYSFDLNQDRFYEPIGAVRSTATSQGYSDLGDGRWYFHVRALDNAGYWSGTKRFGVCIDDTPPRMSTLESTTHPDPTVWVANDDPAFRWSATDTSGITGYSYELTQSPSPAFPANDVSEGTATTRTYTDIATGEWYFHIRSRNGSSQWGEPATVKVRIDVTGPTQPAVTSSTHPDQTLFYPSNDPQVSWSASDSESGIDGYSYALDQNSGTDPDLTSEGTATSKVYQDLDEGTHWFHVRARNGAKSWGPTAHFRINVDALGPDGPSVSSSTHPKGPNGETLWYSKNDPEFEWSASDTSGINGYSHLLDQASDTTPDDDSEGTGTTRRILGVADGLHFFHVKARNGAGVWGNPSHYEIRIDKTKPTRPGAVTSTSHTPLVAFDNRRITMTWSAGDDLPPEGSPLTAVSGVKGYSWAFTSSDTPPALDASIETPAGETTGTSDELFDGVYFFHIATVDNADNRSEVVTYGPMVVDEDGAPISLSPTLDDVLVAHSDELGLEQFYPYRSTGLGAATGFAHLRTGNLVVRKSITRIPGVGLNTVLRHTYNAKRSEGLLRQSGVGRGWTLSVSDLDAGVEGAANAVTSIDLNSSVIPTEFVNQTLATAGFLIEFTDGDGTTHRFIRRDPSPGGRWDSPPGVGLKVREVTDPTTGQVTEYELVRPDGVTYHARKVPVQAGEGVTIDGPVWRIGSITDRNGNELSFSYRAFGNNVTDVRATEIRHDRFTEPLVTMSYDSAGTLQEIVSLPGFSADDPGTGDETPRSWERRYRFSIDTEGLLRSIVENADSSHARTTFFGYAGTPDDADARNEQADVEDARVLEEVTDSRGNLTGLDYDVAGTGTLRVTAVVDRRGKPWTYRYTQPDPSSGEVVTTVDTPVANSATKYRISPRRRISEADARIAGGNILDIEDPGNNSGPGKNSYQWEQNRLVKRTNATGNVTEMTYDDLGMLRSVETPAPNAERSGPTLPTGAPTTRVRTTFTYDYKGGIGACSPPAEPAGGPISHEGFCSTVAEMDKAVAAGSHPGQSRTTDFAYDADGNLTEVAHLDNGTETPADPDRIVKLAYWGSGLLKHIDGPRDLTPDDVTWFGSRENIEQAASPPDPRYGGYSRSGQPRAIRDAEGLFKTFGYTPYGMVGRIEDRGGRITRNVYDDRDNLVETTDPSGDTATFTYDENDNRKTQVSPRGNEPGASAARFTTDYSYNPNDWLEQVRGPGDTPDERPGTTTTYRDDGLRKTVGVATGQGEAITEFFYYDNGQLRRTEAPAADAKAVTNYEYDPAGRETRLLLPQVTSAGARPERTTSYSASGTVTSVKETSARRDDAGNIVMRVTRFAYNAHAEQIETLGPRSNGSGDEAATTQSLNSFGEVFAMRRRVDAAKWLEYGYSYDRAGNQKTATHPTGTGNSLTSSYDYDSLNRLIRETDPFNPGHTTEFSYLPEGQQDKRTDMFVGVVKRVTDTTYNGDYTVRSIVATDRSKDGSPTIATCNWADGAEPGSSYDANDNLKDTRTVKGSSGCAGGETVRAETFDYDE
ncbi:MAG: DNRLRE domain-containing protein, partial [Actinomycetota bacterium]|nr:DNRLRE domain-containing protein [Actinomycetota bacterium]